MGLAFGDSRLPQRFWKKVDQVGSGCWEWNAFIRPDGYGELHVPFGTKLAHRMSYIVLVGMPDMTLSIDHLCRNRRCVNPEHMEPVTRGENVLRGTGISAERAKQTHCFRGHPLAGDNLVLIPRGKSHQRICRTCRSAWKRADHHRNKEIKNG